MTERENMSEFEVYKAVCEPRFTSMENKLSDIHKVICGNGHEGLADTARNNKKWIARVMGALGVIYVAIIAAIVRHFIK